jgi:predicted DNA binding CopG/RHH family protein
MSETTTSKIPKFANEQEEAEFWDTHSITDFLDELTPVDVTVIDSRPRKEQISLRLDRETITRLKAVARQRGIGYQTLIRMWVMERLNQEAG